MKPRSSAPLGSHVGGMETIIELSPNSRRRRFAVGAEVSPDGVHFRVWAPKSEMLAVQLGSDSSFDPAEVEEVELEPELGGYFSGLVTAAEPGMLYKIKLSHGAFPDPASRY